MEKTWHSVSSGLLLHVWRQATLAAHDGFAMHLASSTLENMKAIINRNSADYNIKTLCSHLCL